MATWFKKEKQAVLISNSGKEYFLDTDMPNKIGRSHTEHIVVEDDLGISRQNSLIIRDKQTGAYHIRDLDSKHGTCVNGEKITDDTELKSGDMIEIGKFTKFIFQIK